MPRRDARALILDVREACERIAEVLRGKSMDDYLRDWALRSIIERQFITIGEALSQLSKARPDAITRVSEMRRIVDFRNLLIHGYHTIDDTTVWGIIIDDLPKLESEINALADEP